jgi:catechol 1,2-dioxygenase
MTAEISTASDRSKPGAMSGQLVHEWERVTEPGPGELRQTPTEIQGPYFRLGAPVRSSLLEPGDKPGLVLNGRVLNEKGRPVPGALINIWSSDAEGNYDMVGYRYTGMQVTDEAGRYEFTTIIPGCYEPRNAKHIHMMIQGVSSPVVTQLYIEGEPGNYEDDFYSPQLLVTCSVDDDGTKHGVFDFVIRQVTEQENVTAESLAARV